MPFLTLKSGEEILIDKLDVPSPPGNIFYDNPYLKQDPMFKKWRSAQKARYYKACYKAIKEDKDIADFNDHIRDASLYIKDPTAWREYLSCRGLTQPKRPVGRPKLADHLKKNNPRVKRSDKMERLLAEKGIEVNPKGKLLLNSDSKLYDGWNFQPNGRVKFLGDEEFNIEPYTLSVHQFILEYC